MLINCNVCNIEFKIFPSQKTTKYCSSKCYFERNGKKREIACKICNKKLLATPHDIKRGRKYCSVRCLRRAQSSKPAWNANPIYRNCLNCNKEFRTILAKIKVGKGKFCSKDCYLKDHSKNTWTTGVCKGCNKEFRYIAHRKQTCCSLSCNAKWRRNKHGDSKRITVNCKQCNKQIILFKTRFEDNRGKFCSKACYSRWMSINSRGKKSNNWKGGITPLYKAIRLSQKYRKWRKQVLERDRKCVLCESKRRLEVDHIKEFFKIVEENKIKSTLEANNCKELWNILNGRVLCKICHIKTDSYGFNGLNSLK